MSRRSIAFGIWLTLLVCLGGASAAGWAANALLQLVALALILWTLWTPGPALPAGARPLLWIAALFVALILLSFIPLPADIWRALPGREPIARGLAMLGGPLPALPLSLDARRTVQSALSLLPPLATFLFGLRLTRDERTFTAKLLLVLASGVIVLGAMQVFGGSDSPLRLYDITNPNRAVGTFANPNHLATLLLMAVPIGAFLVGISFAGRRRSAGGQITLWIALTAFLAIGVAINGSLAGYGLLLPAAFLGWLVFRKATGRFKQRDVLLGVAGTVAFAGLSLFGPLNDSRFTAELNEGPAGRTISIPTTLEAARDMAPVGSGLGTFRDVYRTYEDEAAVSLVYVNHAHNDYAEVALELGLPGVLLVLLFLAWWGAISVRAWGADFHGANLARAASVALLLVLLHSLVDYPLRTATIAGLAAMCCAFMLQPPAGRRGSASGDADAPKARHLTVT